MKKAILVIMLVMLLMGTQVYMPSMGGITTKQTGTFTISQTDTIHYGVPSGLVSLTFAVNWRDSVSVTSAIVRRVINSEWIVVQAGDTLGNFTSFASTAAGFRGSVSNPSSARAQAITLDPIPDEFVVIVTYAASGNGYSGKVVNYAFNQVTHN